MSALKWFLLFVPLTVFAADQTEVQKQTLLSVCSTIEKLVGKDLSLEKPFPLYFGLGDWSEDPSGKTRTVPGPQITYATECNVRDSWATIKSYALSTSERMKEGKIELGSFLGTVETQKYIVDAAGKLTAQITFVAAIRTDRVPEPTKTYDYFVEHDVDKVTLTTGVELDDKNTEKKTCTDTTKTPPVKVACKTSVKSTMKKDGDKTVLVREKLAKFYDAQWNFIPNSGWSWGPKEVNTSEWKDIQRDYSQRTNE